MIGGIAAYHFQKQTKYCGIEQLVARESHNLKVGGSSPSTAPSNQNVEENSLQE